MFYVFYLQMNISMVTIWTWCLPVRFSTSAGWCTTQPTRTLIQHHHHHHHYRCQRQQLSAGDTPSATVSSWRVVLFWVAVTWSWSIAHFRLHALQIGSFITSAKEVVFLPDFVRLFVCLSVCLCVSKITQKVMDGSFWNFESMSGMAQTTSDSILRVIRKESWILNHFEIFVTIAFNGA